MTGTRAEWRLGRPTGTTTTGTTTAGTTNDDHRSANRVAVIAHCGDHRHAPKNSLAAFYAAAQAGFDMIETDLRRCRDGIVVHHDEFVAGQPVAELTRRQIQDMSGQLPPLLEDVVECCRGRIAMDLELKEPGLEAEVVESVSELEPGAWLVSSFSLDVLVGVRSLAPDAVTALLSMRGLAEQLASQGISPDERGLAMLTGAVEEGVVDYLAPDVRDAELLAAAAQGSLPVLVWYANDAPSIRLALANSSVRGVITDQPALLHRIFEHDPLTDYPAW
jgi:glycerophosphoryl diester phosphodiesterase